MPVLEIWRRDMSNIPMLAQLYMGRGVNGSTGKAFGVAIEFDTPKSETSGQNTILQLVSISSSRELTETLNISASASFQKGLGGISAEVSFAQSRQFNNYYTYALVQVFVVNPPLLLRKPRFTKEANDLLINEGWDKFAASYGWEYVEGIITGGSYYALIEIQTTNEAEQKDVKGKLSGFYGPFKASVELESTLKDIRKETITNVFVNQSGGNQDPIEISLEAMLLQAQNFPKIASESPVPIIAITSDYQSTIPLPQVEPPDSLARNNQRNILEDYGREYLKFRDYKANIEFVLEHLIEFDDFRTLDAQQLNDKRQEYQVFLNATVKELDKIVDRASVCANDFGQCETYAPEIQPLTLPKIGGDLMNLKQMEERIAELNKVVEQLQSSTGSAQNTANEALNGANAAQNIANQAVNNANAAQNTANSIQGSVASFVNSPVLKEFVAQAQYQVRGDGFKFFLFPNICAWDIFTQGQFYSGNGFIHDVPSPFNKINPQ
jgi:Alanine-zipper, major outer membrane lipoprotein